ncbi:MAG: peptidase, partial [Pseudomonas fluorescens]
NKPTAALQIFKAGTHVAEDGRTLTFSEADVQQIADSYDIALHEAPIVVGHPKTDDPAYGWGKALSSRDGLLFAEPHEVDATFAEMVNAGRFKKISASIFLPDTPGNPTPGKFYLRHIGFLGAQPPAIKGLKSASFSDAGESACFAMSLTSLGWNLTDLFQRFRDWLIDKEGLEAADQVIPQWQIRSIEQATRDDDAPRNSLSYSESNPLAHQQQIHLANVITAVTTNRDQIRPENDPMSQEKDTAQFAERKQVLDQQATNLDAREKALADREKAARRQDAAAFAEVLVTDGKVLPRNKAAIVELLLALPAGAEPLNFAEGDGQVSKPADQVLRELLTGLPKAVDFAEKSGGGEPAGVANFSSPPGTQVDAGRADLFTKAKAYQLQHPSATWAAAVAAVGG